MLNLADLPHSGRPKLMKPEELKAKIDQEIQENRRLTQQQLAEQLGISQSTVHKLIRDLNYQRICAKWVPKLFTLEMEANRKKMCEELLNRYWREGETFLKNLVTGDESSTMILSSKTHRKSTVIALHPTTRRSDVIEQVAN